MPPASYRSTFSGTSGSAPEATGAVALLWSAAPQLIGQVVATTDLLRWTAVPLTSTQDCGEYRGSRVPNAVFGFGRLDVAAAVTAALADRQWPRLIPPRGGPRQVSPR
jgi:subtilisin family serine protease